MIKSIGFFLLWLAGSVAAVAVAWTGVSIVDDELIAPAPAVDQIAASDPSDDAAFSRFSSPAPASSPSPTPAAAPTAVLTPDSNEATSPETQAVPSATAAPEPTAVSTETLAIDPSSTTAPAPTTAANPTTAPPTPTTAPPTSTTVPPTPTTAPPTSTTAPAQTITFNLVGGRTAISFSAARVDVLWATPNPGFTVEIEPKSDGTRVDFEADHHESRIDAWWSGGPQHEIREDAEN